jgi:hypothetical protein
VAAGLAVALAAAANGCEIIANFDRSLIPSEAGGDSGYEGVDGSEGDAVAPADASKDSTASDTGPGVDGGVDSSHQDSGSDASDSNVADTNVHDTNAPDVTDSNVPDNNVPDADAGDDAG